MRSSGRRGREKGPLMSYLAHVAVRLSAAAVFIVVAFSAAFAIAQEAISQMPGVGPAPKLPEPQESSSAVNFSRVIGWPEGRSPAAPAGFEVNAFGTGLDSPRWLYVLPDGDVLVAEARTLPKSDRPAEIQQGLVAAGSVGVSPNQITLLRDADGDGTAEVRETFLENLNQPFGMALVGDDLYVANTDGVLRFPYREGQTRIDAPGELILPLPAGGYNNHWTRNIIATPDGQKLYVSVGSASNVGEHGMDEEIRRANILEINPDGSGEKVFASGLRNPNGMDWEPETGALWTAVNERDELGDDLVPDYITSVRDSGFYGWPYSYYGQNEDPQARGRAAGSRGAGNPARLRARIAHRVARAGVLRRGLVPGALPGRRFHRPARLMESLGVQRLQGRVRAVRRRAAERRCRGFPDRLHGRPGERGGLRAAGRARAPAGRLPARGRRRRRHRLARPGRRLTMAARGTPLRLSLLEFPPFRLWLGPVAA